MLDFGRFLLLKQRSRAVVRVDVKRDAVNGAAADL